MDSVDYIKSELKRLYETAPNVHISVRKTHPRVVIEAAPAVIKGVYKSIFQIEENGSGNPVRHTFRYEDVLIGQVVVSELDFRPRVNVLNKK